MVETCMRNKAKTYLHPIIDWTEQDIWQYIKQEKLNYCKLYDEGFRRLGCVMCPMQGTNGMLRDAERWPKYYESYIRAFDRMIKARKEVGLDTKWETGQEVMDWWIYNPPKIDDNQIALFE